MSLTPYAHLTPMTDTREMPAIRRGVPLADQPTEGLHLLDLRPAVEPVRRRRFLADLYRAATGSLATSLLAVALGGFLVCRFLDATRPLGQVLLTVSHGGIH